MNIKENLSVHNRFLIEVRDAETGELKQTAKAENIVLNNWHIESRPISIHFGSGTDKAQQNPGMTQLIAPISSKTLRLATTEWQNDVFVMNYKADQIGAEEQNGKKLSEVGIESSVWQHSGLISHAFITDSEGNPLTITKTAKDVITLYATVYFKRSYEKYRVNHNDPFIFFTTNVVTTYFFGGGYAQVQKIFEINENRRKKGYFQMSNQQGNGQEIRGVCFSSSNDSGYRIMVFPCAGLYEGTSIGKGKLVGEKNGVNTQFDFPWDCVKNLKLYKNNQLIPESQYTVNTNIKKSNNVLKDLKKVETDGEFDETYIYDLSNKQEYTIAFRKLFNVLLTSKNGGNFYLGNAKNLSEYTIELNKPCTVSHFEVNYRYVYGTNNDGRYNNMKIDVYSNGQWVEMYNGDAKDISKNKLSQDIENVIKVRVKLTNPKSDRVWKQIPWIALYNENDIHHITFNEPPLSTDVLEYDGFVDYIPKDEDHIIKFNFDMTLSPGAGE